MRDFSALPTNNHKTFRDCYDYGTHISANRGVHIVSKYSAALKRAQQLQVWEHNPILKAEHKEYLLGLLNEKKTELRDQARAQAAFDAPQHDEDRARIVRLPNNAVPIVGDRGKVFHSQLTIEIVVASRSFF